MIATYGVVVEAFDPTPRSIRWITEGQWPASFHFHPIGIGASDRLVDFFPPDNPDHVSHTIIKRESTTMSTLQVRLFRLSSIAKMLGHKQVDILKMDIEGAEYEVIDDLVSTPDIPVQQILVEFHHFFPEIPQAWTERAIAKLSAAGYRVFHISDRGLEYSFILE